MRRSLIVCLPKEGERAANYYSRSTMPHMTKQEAQAYLDRAKDEYSKSFGGKVRLSIVEHADYAQALQHLLADIVEDSTGLEPDMESWTI